MSMAFIIFFIIFMLLIFVFVAWILINKNKPLKTLVFQGLLLCLCVEKGQARGRIKKHYPKFLQVYLPYLELYGNKSQVSFLRLHVRHDP